MRDSSNIRGSGDLGIEGYVEPSPIGQGGFGSVYRCKQVAFDRFVAIKVLATSGLNDGVEQRFERECRAVGALSGHPHIVTVHDSGVSQWGRPYIVMDYMGGGSLAQRLQRQGALPWVEAVEIGIKIASGVAAAHAAGIVHRDIKPQNVLVSSYGEPKLSDFGISTIPSGYQTRSGVITTSLAYAPPEVLNGEPAKEPSDIYSTAATIFALMKGSPPFVEDGEEGVAALVARTLTKPVPDLRSSVPASVCEVLERAMSKRPSDRFSTAADLGQALKSAQQASMVADGVRGVSVPAVGSVDVRPTPVSAEETISRIRQPLFEEKRDEKEAPRRTRLRLVVMMTSALLILASSGVALALRDSKDPRPPVAVEPSPSASPTKAPERPPERAAVKRFTIAYDRTKAAFAGDLTSSKGACDANRKIELRKWNTKRPIRVVRTSNAGAWRVRVPNAPGLFRALVGQTQRTSNLICPAATTRWVKLEQRKAAAPHLSSPQGGQTSGPSDLQEPVPPTPPPPTAPPQSSEEPSEPPKDEAECPPRHHLEEDGRCWPD